MTKTDNKLSIAANDLAVKFARIIIDEDGCCVAAKPATQGEFITELIEDYYYSYQMSDALVTELNVPQAQMRFRVLVAENVEALRA